MKKIKSTMQAHTSKSQKGMGDYYGQGLHNKVGKVREDMVSPKTTSKTIGKKPKSLA